MYPKMPSSSSITPPVLRHILWVPGSLLGVALLLGFRFYESGKSGLAPSTSAGSFLMAAAEPSPVSAGAPASALAPQSGDASKEASKDKAKTPPPNALTEGTGKILKDDPSKNKTVARDEVADESVDILNLNTEEVKILQSLSARRSDVEKREKSILEREQLLEAAEGRIDDKVRELQKIREILKKMLAKFQSHEKERMKGLVKIYELMKPDKAALIFEGLSLDVLLDVVDMMKESKLSPVLGTMNPHAAQRLTEELAARRKFTEELYRLNQQEEASEKELEVPQSMTGDKAEPPAPPPEDPQNATPETTGPEA